MPLPTLHLTPHDVRRTARGESGCLFFPHRGREQACARPPAQIPAYALTHGAPASDDDERPLVRPRALKPLAVTRELRLRAGTESVSFTTLIGSAEWSFPPIGWVSIPRGLYRLGYPDPLGRQHSECKTPFRVSLRSFSHPVSLHDTLSVDCVRRILWPPAFSLAAALGSICSARRRVGHWRAHPRAHP